MKETLLEHNSQVSLRGCSIGYVEILNTNHCALIFSNVSHHNQIWQYADYIIIYTYISHTIPSDIFCFMGYSTAQILVLHEVYPINPQKGAPLN